MIRKTVHKGELERANETRENLEYWLSRPPAERIAAVELLRRQVYGDLPRLQRTVKIIRRS